MRSRLILAGFLFALSFAVIAWAQAPETESPATPPVDPSILQTAAQMENDWLDHLEKPPKLVRFQWPEGETVDTREDRWRQHIFFLREKSRSNRAWYEYWKRQHALTKTLVESIDSAVATGPDAPSMLSVRKQGAQAWMDLAADKMTNQDAYLKAIDTEKEAYEVRLDNAVMAQTDREAGSDKGNKTDKETIVLQDAERRPTSFQLHKNRLRSLERQRRDQLEKFADARSDSQFTTQLIQATQILLEAEKADVQLAEREREIARQQATHPNGDATWQTRWQAIFAKVDLKVEKLRKVSEDQADKAAQLEAEKSYFEALAQIKQDRAKDIEKKIALEKKQVFKAILLTAKEIVARKGLMVLGYLLAAYLTLRIIRRASRVVIDRAADDDPDNVSDQEQRAETLVSVFSSLARFAVYVLVLLLFLDALGVNIGPLMGAFAILGLAVSFGSQNLVKDLVNGFFILLENQLSVGDVVTVAGISGTVEKISLRRVVLRDMTGAVHSIPNSEVDKVTNKTSGWGRAIVHVGVSYSDDLRKVREVYNEVGRIMFEDPDWKGRLTEAPSVVGVTELGDSAVVVRVWAKTCPQDLWAVERELNLRLKEASDANGIEIPYPQRVVEIKKN